MKKSFVLFSAAIASFALSACGGSGDSGKDPSKTNIKFYYHNGALRDEWVNHAVADFESMYANTSFEKGKTGVAVEVNAIKGDPSVENISSNSNDVFWVESLDYYTISNYGGAADITDVIKAPAICGVDNNGNEILEEKTIESKMRDASKAFYNLGTTDSPKYKALPAFESSFFINYNVDLFNQKKFYFAKGKTAEGATFDLDTYGAELADLFITSLDDEKSAGPDGVYGTSDDGLPATFADFRALLTNIKIKSVLPFVWNGLDTGMGYLTSFLLTVWGNTNGADALALSNSFVGQNTNYIKLENEKIVKDSSGNPVVEAGPTAVDGSNAYTIHQQKGVYDALNFANIIMSNKKNYYSEGFSPAFTHRNCQKMFVNGYESGSIEQPIAMMIEANWWNSEATDDYISAESKMEKNYGIMPVPHADASGIGGRNVMVSDRKSSLFVRSTTKGAKLEVAKKFVSYLNSDVCMNTFSKYTDMMRNLEYELDDATYNSLTPYGKRFYEFSSATTTDHLDWLPTTAETRKNLSLMAYEKWGFKSDSTKSPCPFKRFGEDSSLTVDKYFEEINHYYSSNWSTLYTKPKN